MVPCLSLLLPSPPHPSLSHVSFPLSSPSFFFAFCPVFLYSSFPLICSPFCCFLFHVLVSLPHSSFPVFLYPSISSIPPLPTPCYHMLAFLSPLPPSPIFIYLASFSFLLPFISPSSSSYSMLLLPFLLLSPAIIPSLSPSLSPFLSLSSLFHLIVSSVTFFLSFSPSSFFCRSSLPFSIPPVFCYPP